MPEDNGDPFNPASAAYIGNTEAGDICNACALIGEPGALCPKHAAADDMLAALRQARDGLLAAFPHADRIRDILQPTIEAVRAAIAKAGG
jgi:hypothetical protein